MKEQLPNNLEVERFVLGSILLDDVAYPTAAAALSLDDFFLEKHRRIWRRMGDIAGRGEHIDRVTIAEELQRHGELGQDDLGYLVSLDDGLPRVPNLDSYIRILQDKAARRRVMFACANLSDRCALAGEDIEGIVEAGQNLFAGIGARKGQQYHSISDIPSVRDCGAGEIEYIREPELPKGAVVALTGDSGSGKSTLVTAWGRDAAVPVLFLDRENPLSAIADRLERLGIEDGPDFLVWGGWLAEEAPQPDAAVVRDWVKTCEPRPLVVVDSLAAFHGGDQNDAGEMRTFMHKCRRLADLGATVVVIHHDGKAETAKDYRGSSDFKAAIDTGFHVSNFSADSLLDKLVLRPFKARFGVVGELSYQYAGGQFIRGDAGEARQTVSEKLTALLRQYPGVNSKRFADLAIERGMARNQARVFLNDGVLSGAIHRETSLKNLKRYFLAGTEKQNQL
jgi:hypothetical protein